MVLKSNLIKSINSIVSNLIKNDQKSNITMNCLRSKLLEYTFSDKEWKELKPELKEQVQRILSEHEEEEDDDVEEVEEMKSSPVKAVKVKKSTSSKYDRAASKNLQVFTDLVAGPSLEMDDENEEEEEYSGSSEVEVIEDEEPEVVESEQEDQEEVVEAAAKAPAKEKQRKPSTTKSTNDYLSKEMISDSDEEASDLPRRKRSESIAARSDSASGSASGSKKKKVVEKRKEISKSIETSEPSRKKEKSTSTTQKKKKESKPRTKTSKPGDAELGTETQESRIKSLKSLLVAAGTQRPFTPSTGAERTLSVEVRLDRLEGLLSELGLPAGKDGKGKLPSLDKAKVIGERRALEKEMKELEGVPIVSGLRGGKKRAKEVESSEEESEEEEVKPKRLSAKAFAAFLGDQSSSE